MFDGLVHAFACFCAGLKVLYVQLVCHSFCVLGRHCSLTSHIPFVSDQYLPAVFIRLLLNFGYPKLIDLCITQPFTFEAGLVREVEQHQNPISFFEIALRQTKKFLLACSVPDTHGYILSVDFHVFLLEGQSESGGVELVERG